MSNVQEVVVNRRDGLGKGETGRLRKQGMIPCVVYGLEGDAVSVSVQPKAISRVIHSEIGLNSVLNLRMADTEQTRHVMIKSLDRHPVTDRLIHIDFLRIDMDKKVSAVVPVETVGVPEGVKLGGVLTVVRHELEILCLPSKLLGAIKVDVSKMVLMDTLRIGDLPSYDGVEYVLGPSRVVASVRPKGQESLGDEDDEDETEGAVAE
jgi:large subunit ribosomal protein L25